MRAYVIEEAGGPEKFLLQELPDPEPKEGEVLIRVRAFGLNRSEWFTRRGDSPSVIFPRVLGIECVGEVIAAPGTDLQQGQKVVALMGGMGREYNGSYAEMTRVPREHVHAVETQLPWEEFAAYPEMLQTTHGSLHVGLEIDRAKTLLIRGGTSSVGLAALALATRAGLEVSTTTRNPAKAETLKAAGATHVFIDDGSLAPKVRETYPDGVDRVFELIGTKTVMDSLRCVPPRGIVCVTGILGGEWVLENFEPMGGIPTGVKLTAYSGGSGDISQAELQGYLNDIAKGEIEIRRGPVFPFEELVAAHQAMDANRANGKMVVKVG